MAKIPKKKKEAVYAFWRQYPEERTTASRVLAQKFDLQPRQISSLKGAFSILENNATKKAEEVDDENVTIHRNDGTKGIKNNPDDTTKTIVKSGRW